MRRWQISIGGLFLLITSSAILAMLGRYEIVPWSSLGIVFLLVVYVWASLHFWS